MTVVELIERKRDGGTLSPEEWRTLMASYAAGDVPDYQIAALAMAVYFRGMDSVETEALMTAMLDSGRRLDLDHLTVPRVDKHSTGGVGDKVSIVLAPLVAACGVAVPMMSGRGLGHTGGTLDKLESIPGFRTRLTLEEAARQVERLGCALIGQTDEIAPADRRFYSLRDATATVEAIPLIAASIMSKKLAVGADALVLDVKVGEGALVPEPDDARRLAELMIGIGQETGIRTRAVLADMSQPLGRAVGNLIEVQEAIAVLQGEDVPGLTHLCRDLACEMLRAANPSLDAPAASVLVSDAISSGRALETFRAWVVAQGGSPDVVDDPRSVPSARRHAVVSSADGWVGSVSARSIGTVALSVGAGRRRTEDTLDHLAGVVVHRRVGDPVARGELLAELVTDLSAPERHLAELAAAFGVVSSPPSEMPWHHELVVGADEASAPPSTGTQEEER